jgi:hypothetical protein
MTSPSNQSLTASDLQYNSSQSTPGSGLLVAARDVGLYYSFTGFSAGSLAAMNQYSAYILFDEPGIAACQGKCLLKVSGLTDEASNVMVPAAYPVQHNIDTPTPFIKVSAFAFHIHSTSL